MLIFRGIDGRLEPWDPRVHPGPWTERLSRRGRRWLARHGHRGRRGATRMPAMRQRPADALPECVVRRKACPEIPFAEFAVFAPYEEEILKRYDYAASAAYPCPHRARGPECSERCWRDRVHVQRIEAVVYCSDPKLYEAAVTRALNNEASRAARHMAHFADATNSAQRF